MIGTARDPASAKELARLRLASRRSTSAMPPALPHWRHAPRTSRSTSWLNNAGIFDHAATAASTRSISRRWNRLPGGQHARAGAHDPGAHAQSAPRPAQKADRQHVVAARQHQRLHRRLVCRAPNQQGEAALNQVTKLPWPLNWRRVSYVCVVVHPGWVRTDMERRGGHLLAGRECHRPGRPDREARDRPTMVASSISRARPFPGKPSGPKATHAEARRRGGEQSLAGRRLSPSASPRLRASA